MSATTPLIGFSGKIIWPIGQIQLLVKIGDEEHFASAWMNFVVVRSPSSYNEIIGRPRVKKLQAVPLTAHGMLKIPVKGGVITLKSSKLVQLECAMRNLDIFAWKPVDMTGVPGHIAEHRLNVREGCSPVRQKKRGQAADRNQAIQEEVGKLMEMPFGLRNAGATYQCLVDKAFHKQIGRNLEVYVDDLIIKSCTEDEIVRDIEETFKTLREINMKLNPKKCTFGVEERMFLGFLAKSAEKSLPFFKTLKKCTKKSNFHWTAKAEEAFKQMKQLIAELPMLTALMEKEELIVYLAAAKETILADFIVERPEEDSPDTLMEVEEELLEPWILFTDGSSCTDGSGAGLILTNPEGMEFTYALRFRFDATNNEAKYEALIFGLRIAEQMGVKNLQANVDSRLVVTQVNGMYVAKEADMIRYLEKVRTLTNSFKAFSIRQVPRSENKKIDALSKIASTSFAHLSKQVLVEELKEKSISKVEILVVMEEVGDTWMTPIFNYLEKGTLPADVKKARAVRHKSWQFSVIDGTLYKKSFLGPWLRCVGPLQANYVVREIHEDLVACTQTNGLVERANHSLGEGIKARLDARSKNWMEELPYVLWTHRTMIKSSNGDTPFSLTYGTEAVIPTWIDMLTLKTTKVDLVQNNEALGINLDLLEEQKEEAAIREAKSKARMEKYYNSKVKNTSFKPGDLVYRNKDARRTEDTRKLGPK
ncbi:reverse transcriptase domain-containing protein [Tanacetum coccineum]